MGMQVFTVAGMRCEHCVRAVTDEITSLLGVERVDVDLGSGAVTVATVRELDEAEVAGAVEEAGYELVRDTSEQRR
jgi:copper chaperone